MIENTKLKLTTKSQIVIRPALIWDTIELPLMKITLPSLYFGKPDVSCSLARLLLMNVSHNYFPNLMSEIYQSSIVPFISMDGPLAIWSLGLNIMKVLLSLLSTL